MQKNLKVQKIHIFKFYLNFLNFLKFFMYYKKISYTFLEVLNLTFSISNGSHLGLPDCKFFS